MSQTIWTRCGGLRNRRAISTTAWRVVEDQFQNSTLKLVDSVAEQSALEDIIDEVGKPPRPSGPEFARLHFLLYTPFRYPPLHRGSRFAARSERGLWYGALDVTTALAEKAYYRLVFLLGSAADLGTVEQAWSAFSASIATDHAIDLTRAPFAAHEAKISSPTSYTVSQPLGREMRDAGVVLCKFTSARDRDRGANIALFTPAFTSRRVDESAHVGWMSRASRRTVQVFRKNFARPAETVREYRRSYFEIDGKFPMPAAS
jgi:hypothetical protein